MKTKKFKVSKVKSPNKATLSEAFDYVLKKQWSSKQFDDFVLKAYKTGYDYGVQDIKDNYILSPR